MIKNIFILVGLIFLEGCALNPLEQSVLGVEEGRDGLKKSACAHCRKSSPFYEKGEWIEKKERRP